jgi:low temperature requirement protein LtrA
VSYSAIWGPPRKFSDRIQERRISWLELFFDLVYVLAIARITHHLSTHFNLSGLLDYIYIFGMIFWGWTNGSYHHDLHGNRGLRTNLMTLWQIMIVAVLIVTLSSPPEKLIFNATVAIIIMQVYITYLWWSVGIYDKEHRHLNRPYTICFLISLFFLFITFYIDINYSRIFYFISLGFNLLPPFLLIKQSRSRGSSFSLSSGMTERLGLFTIILFGEVVGGVVYGASANPDFNFNLWLNFGLAILIVFGLWWIFFTLIADLRCTKGFFESYIMILVYIPVLMSLGMTGACFNSLFLHLNEDISKLEKITSFSLCIFLCGIAVITWFLDFPVYLQKYKKRWQIFFFITGILIAVLGLVPIKLPAEIFFIILLFILILLIVEISRGRLNMPVNSKVEEAGGN